MDPLLVGLSLGLAAGVGPGPLLLLVVTSSLRSGWRTGTLVACAPLVSDVLVVAGVLLVLDRLPSIALSMLGVLGALFVIYTGGRTVVEARTADLGISHQGARSLFVALRQAAAINLLSPHPWIFWATVLGPLTIATARTGLRGAVALILGFYLGLVGAKIVIAALVSGQRRRLSQRGYRRALVGAGALLILTGVLLLTEYVPALL